jgi:nucleotide-binding universal stress UspA family protein
MSDILCPTDLTPAGDTALTIGGRIASKYDASVTILHVLEKDQTRHGNSAMSAKSVLSHAEEELLRTSRARTVLREGDFMKEIAEESSRDHVLMVVGTHGAQGLRQSLFGADILKLVRKVSIPSLVVQEGSMEGQDFRTIVMPVAGHSDIGVLLDTVTRLGRAFGSTVHVYRIERPGEEPSPQLLRNTQLMLEHLRGHGVQVEEVTEPTRSFSVGFAAQTGDYAARVGADCIAIMARASDEYRWIADAEKERLLANTHRIPVLCAN